MNAKEAATLCRAAKSVCPQQKFDEFTPDFWHPLLEDVSFEDAKRALIEVAKRQPFVSPAEIRTEVALTRKRLVAAIPAVVPPWQLADTPAEEQRWVANYRHAIADGMPTDGAYAKANYMSGIENEPVALEPPSGMLREQLDRTARELEDKQRMAEIQAEVDRQAKAKKRAEQEAAHASATASHEPTKETSA